MKKILIMLIALISCMNIDAQYINIYQGARNLATFKVPDATSVSLDENNLSLLKGAERLIKYYPDRDIKAIFTEEEYTVDNDFVLLGEGTFVDNFWFENETKVDIYQYTKNPNVYRMKNPFKPMIASWELEPSEDASEYFYFEVKKAGEKIYGEITEKDGYVFYHPGVNGVINTGYFHSRYNQDILFMHPIEFVGGKDREQWKYNCVYAYQEDGVTPAVIMLAPEWYLSGLGGWCRFDAYRDVMIYMPGVDREDYDNYSFSYVEQQEEGENIYQVFDITLSKCICRAEYLLADGKPELVYNKIKNHEEGVQTLTSSQQIKVLDESELLRSIVVVFYDLHGEEIAALYQKIDGQLTWTPLYVGDYYHRVQSYAKSDLGVFSNRQSKLNAGSVLYSCDQDDTMYKIAPWVLNELIFTMDANNNITVLNQNSGKYYEGNPYICATDLFTAGIDNIYSGFDNEENIYWFELLWHDEDDTTAQGGAWGFTEDAFVIRGEYEENAKPMMMIPSSSNLPSLVVSNKVSGINSINKDALVKERVASKIEKSARALPGSKCKIEDFMNLERNERY